MNQNTTTGRDGTTFLAQVLCRVKADAAALHVATDKGLIEAASVPAAATIPLDAPRLCLQRGAAVHLDRPGEALRALVSLPLPRDRGTLSLGWSQAPPLDEKSWQALEAYAETASWIMEAQELRDRLQDCLADQEEQELANPPADPGERNAASLSRMARQLGHDLRGPLANLRVALDLLQGADPEEQESLLNRLDAEIGHATNLIADRVYLTRALQPHMSPMTLAAAARQAAMEVRRPSDVRLELNLDQEATFLGDAELLSHMLVLLADNAVEALEAGGVLRLVVARTPVGAELRVEDSGTGIPAELRQRVMNPGFTTRERGSGLGLAICSRIAKAHGGSLNLETSDLGGTAAVVRLPPQ